MLGNKPSNREVQYYTPTSNWTLASDNKKYRIAMPETEDRGLVHYYVQKEEDLSVVAVLYDTTDTTLSSYSDRFRNPARDRLHTVPLMIQDMFVDALSQGWIPGRKDYQHCGTWGKSTWVVYPPDDH